MIKEISLPSWNDFGSWLKELRISSPKTLGLNPLPLFRGHRSKFFRIEDTLYRRHARETSIAEYYRLVKHVRHPLETFMQQRWDIPEIPEVLGMFSEYDKGSLILQKGLPGYDCLLYMRHNGFPSPLLDWSRSPYVAAFFAFQQSFNEGEPDPTICTLVQWSDIQIHTASEPILHRTGQYVSAHARHHLQQCDYTFCSEYNSEDKFWSFTSHEDYLQSSANHYYNVFKVTLPKSERVKVLKDLDRYNLNAYSLFGDPESLLETLAFRVFEGERASTHPLRPRTWNDL